PDEAPPRLRDCPSTDLRPLHPFVEKSRRMIDLASISPTDRAPGWRGVCDVLLSSVRGRSRHSATGGQPSGGGESAQEGKEDLQDRQLRRLPPPSATLRHMAP